jgi:hypothetical protein
MLSANFGCQQIIRRVNSFCVCLIVLLGCGYPASARTPSPPTGEKRQVHKLPARRLTLQEIFSWHKYDRLVGMSEEQVAEVLGAPREEVLQQDGVMLDYQHSTTDGRLISLEVVNSRVSTVRVYPKADESFDIAELVASADQYKFTSGIIEMSSKPFLAAAKGSLTIRIVALGSNGSTTYTALESVLLH